MMKSSLHYIMVVHLNFLVSSSLFDIPTPAAFVVLCRAFPEFETLPNQQSLQIAVTHLKTACRAIAPCSYRCNNVLFFYFPLTFSWIVFG